MENKTILKEAFKKQLVQVKKTAQSVPLPLRPIGHCMWGKIQFKFGLLDILKCALPCCIIAILHSTPTQNLQYWWIWECTEVACAYFSTRRLPLALVMLIWKVQLPLAEQNWSDWIKPPSVFSALVGVAIRTGLRLKEGSQRVGDSRIFYWHC